MLLSSFSLRRSRQKKPFASEPRHRDAEPLPGNGFLEGSPTRLPPILAQRKTVIKSSAPCLRSQNPPSRPHLAAGWPSLIASRPERPRPVGFYPLCFQDASAPSGGDPELEDSPAFSAMPKSAPSSSNWHSDPTRHPKPRQGRRRCHHRLRTKRAAPECRTAPGIARPHIQQPNKGPYRACPPGTPFRDRRYETQARGRTRRTTWLPEDVPLCQPIRETARHGRDHDEPSRG